MHCQTKVQKTHTHSCSLPLSEACPLKSVFFAAGAALAAKEEPQVKQEVDKDSAMSIKPADSVSAVGNASSSSSNAKGGGYVSPPARMKDSAARYLKDITLESVLAGDPKRWDLYQARRAMEALEKSNPYEPAVLEWKGRHANILKAQALLQMEKLKPEVRTEYLLDMQRAGVRKWPCKIQAQCLNLFFADACGKQPLDCQAIVSVLEPCGQEGVFNPLQPTLATCSLPDKEKAKLFLRVSVSNLLIPLVVSERLTDLQALCTKITETFAEFKSESLTPVFIGAISELQDCIQCLQALLNPLHQGAVTALDSVTTGTGGVKLLLKNAIHASQKFQFMEQKLRKCEAATVSMGPQVKELTELLQACALGP